MHHINGITCGAAPLGGASLIEIYGYERVLIENHRGIACYEQKQILVKVDFGMIIISGGKLALRNMSKYKIIITGDIHSVNLHRRGKTDAIF